MVASRVDIYTLSFVEEDVAVGCFDDGADGEGVAEFLAGAIVGEGGFAGCYGFCVGGVAEGEVEGRHHGATQGSPPHTSPPPPLRVRWRRQWGGGGGQTGYGGSRM